MLTKSINNRLTSIDLIKEHSYFKDFSFDELINLNLDPAYLPNVQFVKNLKTTSLKKHLDTKTDLNEIVIRTTTNESDVFYEKF